MINVANLNPKQKIYLTAIAWLAAGGLIAAFVALPLISQIKNDGLELAQKKQDAELFNNEWQTLAKAQKDYQTMQNELNALPALLPSSEALKFIVLMEKFAQITNNQQNVSVSDAQPAKDQKKTTTDFQVSLRGRFPDLIKFLIYLENAPYYNDIRSLAIQRLSTKESTGAAIGDINTILNLSVY